jgi:hypothetical protein
MAARAARPVKERLARGWSGADPKIDAPTPAKNWSRTINRPPKAKTDLRSIYTLGDHPRNLRGATTLTQLMARTRLHGSMAGSVRIPSLGAVISMVQRVGDPLYMHRGPPDGRDSQRHRALITVQVPPLLCPRHAIGKVTPRADGDGGRAWVAGRSVPALRASVPLTAAEAVRAGLRGAASKRCRGCWGGRLGGRPPGSRRLLSGVIAGGPASSSRRG